MKMVSRNGGDSQQALDPTLTFVILNAQRKDLRLLFRPSLRIR
jgi:hypothetical protein